MSKLIRKNQEPAKGALDIGGYSVDSREKRERLSRRYDPVGGFGVINQYLYSVINNATNSESNGEEQAFWETYLGLREMPKGKHRTEWDAKIEADKRAAGLPESDFYGTTNAMDEQIQAIADTTNTGKIVRNYDYYKTKYPHLASKSSIKHIYETGKKVMDNPGTWQQAEEGSGLSVIRYLNPVTDEDSPLGMLGSFGMRWNPDSKTIEVHDTYDFPKFYTKLGIVPERPKEMKIRGKINFDPSKGAKIFRDGE